MAIPLIPIILGIIATRQAKKLLKKWLDVGSFEEEMGYLAMEVAIARRDHKLSKEEARKVFHQAKKAGIAYLLKKIL